MKKFFSYLVVAAVMFPVALTTSCDNEDDNPKEFNVSFETGDSDINVEPKKVKDGEKVEKPNDPIREGYIFDGWYKDVEWTSEWKFDIDVVTTNTTLYAKWSENDTQTNYIEVEMIFVQGGTFTMGCTAEQGTWCYDREKPAHQVTVSSFNIAKYPVTQGLWSSVMDSNPSNFKKGDDFPVENVSWTDAQEFIVKLNAVTGKNYRLPTEAEWEYAARGGSQSKGYRYSGSNDPDDVAWYLLWALTGSTYPVGEKQPNELGIHDMSGNVDEWCSDWYGDYSAEEQNNPTGPSSGVGRVRRGGSWGDAAVNCRVSYRFHNNPDSRNSYLGFRLVLP